MTTEPERGPDPRILSIGVLVSGRGTNLQAILDAIAAGRLDARVVLVASDRPGIPALERASRAGLSTAVFDEAAIGSRRAAHAAIADALRARGAELVVLAGFARILDDRFFERLAGVPVINVHPALLPSFGGRGMIGAKVHQAVLASGQAESGVTVHRAEPGKVDEGEILVQRRVPVLAGDTPESLAARVLAQEHEALVEA
ncbi:MAG: phosphoribosylglycinamide formyltransferase, partial [Candidatus Limnocylindria bacterium]